MGEQVGLQQQTRVLLLNGQTIILESDVGENSINEINAEILEQALQETSNVNNEQSHSQIPSDHRGNDNLSNQTVSGSTNNTVQENQHCGSFDENDSNNFVAIFENENGETQTVQLTLEQAAALGFQVAADAVHMDKKQDNRSATEASILPKKEISHSFASSEITNDPLSVTLPMQTATSSQPERNVQPQPSTILGSLLKPAPSSLISIVPQYVGTSTMSYSVKMPESINMNQSSVQVPVTDFLPSVNTITSTASSSTPLTSEPNQTVCMSQSQNTNMFNQPKVALLPIANKNMPLHNLQQGRSIVRLKQPNTIVATPAIIRPATSKTIIPKIQGTPTTMANLAMSSALPISSTASMVRVLNTSATTNVKPASTTNVKPYTTSVKPVTSNVNKPATSATTTTVATTSDKNIDSSTVTRLNTNVTKPLGSSENPIQLVQHGQTYHSMQPLSQEQLKQIATVLQQKQLDTSRNSKNVLYDATTNTRIIYRVVYPEDLALKKPTSGITLSHSASTRGRGASTSGGRKGRPPKALSKANFAKRNSDGEDDQAVDSDLSKGEKEEKKKVLPRTRSGRLSRPPRHMVKDYKRIHHLDFAEPDLDDSDGGYSDYRISDSEANPDACLEEIPNEASFPQMHDNPDAINTKRAVHSKFRCPTCKKMYLGYRRLARHFESNPDHGTMDDVPREPPQKPKTSSTESVNGGGRVGIVGCHRGRGRHKRGGHLILTPAQRAERRKAKLKEFLAAYESSEIAEIAGPVLAQSLDSWQFLLLRLADREDQQSRLAALVSEMHTFLETARSRVSEVLSAQSMLTSDIAEVHKVEVNDLMVASALNISCGIYNILETDDRRLEWHPSSFNLQSSTSSALAPESLPQPQTHISASILNEPAAKKMKLWSEERDNDKIEDEQSEKSFLDTTAESEKPSDMSMGSDTPLDDIVNAELKNLASKSGLEDFVAPPVTSSLAHSQVVDFVTSSFSSTVQGTVTESHFPPDLVMDMPNVASTASSDQMQTASSNTPKIAPVHYELSTPSPTTRLDLNGPNIHVHLDSHLEEATHHLDFGALNDEFNRNTNN